MRTDLVLLVGALGVLVLTGAASAVTLRVPNDHGTIGAAVAAAQDRDE